MKAGDAFFPMPKSFLEEHWAEMSKDEQAVCVALVSCYDSRRECFPGDKYLAAQAGVAVKNVAPAVEALVARGLIARKPVDKGVFKGKPGYVNALALSKRGNVFLQAHLVRSGCWADLSSVGRALYIAMRCAAEIDDDAKDVLLSEIDEIDGIETELGEDAIRALYGDLEWMICTKSQTDLCMMAGIHRSKFKKAQEDLLAHGLLEPLTEGGNLKRCYVRFWSETWKAMSRSERRVYLLARREAGATTGSLLAEMYASKKPSVQRPRETA